VTLDELSPDLRRSLRENALAGIAYPLFADEGDSFGPPLLPLTPWHHLLLAGYGNPCFCGGEITLRDLLQYLWLCSPQCRAACPLRLRLFAWRWRASVSSGGRPTARAIAAVRLHAEAVRMDRPPLPREREAARSEAATPGRDGPHELLGLESACRRYLHYTRAEFWHTPYVTTNGLLRLQFSATSPDMPKFNRTRDKQAGAYLRARLRREREARFAAAAAQE
jgi:hypothetical protein